MYKDRAGELAPLDNHTPFLSVPPSTLSQARYSKNKEWKSSAERMRSCTPNTHAYHEQAERDREQKTVAVRHTADIISETEQVPPSHRQGPLLPRDPFATSPSFPPHRGVGSLQDHDCLQGQATV